MAQQPTDNTIQGPPSKDKANTNDIKGDVTLSIRGVPEFDRFPFKKAKEKFLFMASIKAPLFRNTNRVPIDLVCVIDESSSMSGERIKLVKETVCFIIKNMEKNDRFGCVGYSTSARIIIPLIKCNSEGRTKALDAVRKISARGCTALCAGLCEGINMLRRRDKNKSNSVASVMLFTDGEANEGPKTAGAIIDAMNDPKWDPIISSVHPKHNQNPYLVQNQAIHTHTMQHQGPIYQNPYAQGHSQSTQNLLPTNVNQNQKYAQLQGHSQSNPINNIGNQNVKATAALDKAKASVNLHKIHKNLSNNNFQPGAQDKNTPSTTNTKSNNSSVLDEKEGQNDVDGEDEDPQRTLPCIINTFGFGADHNCSVLEAIAEAGRGMYAFIENTDMIAETFAEALGGLVSVIGTDLKVRVEALNNVEIVKCLSKGFKIRTEIEYKKMVIYVHDIQSEESRDFVFEINLTSIAKQNKQCPIMQLSVEYHNVIKDKKDILSTVCCVDRNEGMNIGEKNVELDMQYNRIIAAEAMLKASELAAKQQMQRARMVMQNASRMIQTSPSSACTYSRNLMSDLHQNSATGLSSYAQYSSVGRQQLHMNNSAHRNQRSMQSGGWSGHSNYTTSNRSSMKSNFK